MAYLSKYGVARTIRIPIVKRGLVDFAVSADWTPAAGDVKISKDGGAFANVANLPTALASANTGALWLFALTATEMQAAQVTVIISDAATKAVEDQAFDIETYGNASGQHPFDLATAQPSVTVAAMNAGVLNAAAIAASTGLLIRSGTAQAGAGSTITLDAGAIATDNIYSGSVVVITGGTGVGQHRVIASYVGATKVATVAVAWTTNPDNTSTFAVIPAWSFVDALGAGSITSAAYAAGAINAVALNANTGIIIRTGTAQAGAASTITLDAGASATTDIYKGATVVTTGGTGPGQHRVITAYNGGTKVATVGEAWATNPDGTTTFAVLPARAYIEQVRSDAIDANAIATDAFGALELAAGAGTEIATAVWAQAMSDLAAVPAANASALAALNWVFEQMRNKITQSPTTITVFKDDGATTVAQAGVSDDGVTMTRGEFA